MAERLSVSRVTISQVLSGKVTSGRISAALQERANELLTAEQEAA